MSILAARPSDDLVLVSDIAEQRKVPKKFLELILLNLKNQGLLRSRRGKNGGYGRARPANEITFGAIIRTTDGPLAPLACASLSGYCKCDDCEGEQACAIRKVMRGVRDSMSAIFDKVTLADAFKT